ncbi:MAG: DNA polymerase III subunit beta [Nitrospirota bacterium]
MKLKVSKDEMLKKLSNIQNIVEKKNTMPILSHFLLDANKNGSYIVANDLEMTIKEPIDVTVEEEGKLCVPARKLFEIVKEMEGDVSFESAGDQWLKLKAGRSDFKIACLSVNDFPPLPVIGEAEDINIEADILMEMIEKTLYSAGESDTRYTLNGLLFHVNPSNLLTVVGTDGHRLAIISKQIDGGIKSEKKLIVPRKAVSELRRFLPVTKSEEDKEPEKITILIGEKNLLFNISPKSPGNRGVQFMTRLIEGTYPNYENVVPQANEKKMTIEKDTFAKVLRRMSVISRERASAVRFDLERDNLVVSSSNPDLGESKEEVGVDYKNEKLTVGFNAKYLIDALGAMASEKVILELQDPLSPVLVKEEGVENYTCVIMPMRI